MNETLREHLVKNLSASIFEQLKDSPYFPCLALNYFDPDVSDDLIYEAWEKLKPQWGERSKEDIKRLVYVYWKRDAIRKWRKIDKGESDILVKSLYVDPCDYKAIDEIGGYETISLFELAVFTGKKVLQNPIKLIFDCPDFFAEHILNGRLNPRDPETKIAYTDSPQKSRLINGKIDFYKPIPDLSWELTHKEAADIAQSIWNAGYLFADTPSQETNGITMPTETTTSAENNFDSPMQGRPEIREKTLLKIILGMAIDAYGYDPAIPTNKATGEQRGSIKLALDKIPGLSTDADTIRKYLTEAAKQYPTAKPIKTDTQTESVKK